MELIMNKASKILATMACSFGLVACASTTYQPVVDLQNSDPMKYQQDLAACRKLSEQVNVAEDSAVNTLIGGVAGAGLGAALGAISGSAGAGAAMGAATGGIGAGAGSAVSKNERVKNIIDKCLTRRGYNVLG
jgi:outer membrane lipoprotein SlyB